MSVRKIISGGQTGADRAALDLARDLGIATGGWVPKGRRAEDGRIPDDYGGLSETGSVEYAERTAFNVRDSDATLLISFGRLSGGSLLTRRVADKIGRPSMHVDLLETASDVAALAVRNWLARSGCRILNVAGPRASEDPWIYPAVRKLLLDVFQPSGQGPEPTGRDPI